MQLLQGICLLPAAVAVLLLIVANANANAAGYGNDNPEPPKPYTLLGCFVDKPKRDLELFPIKTGATPATCYKKCKSLNFPYFSVQFGGACFCGKDYGKYGRTPMSECNYKCKADKSLNCGGFWRNEVYRIEEIKVKEPPKPYTLLGCFVDKPERDLELFSIKTGATPATCYKKCKSLKFPYFSVQFGGECFCGKYYGKYGRTPMSECNHKCKADKSMSCGGVWRNEVYRIEEIKAKDCYGSVGGVGGNIYQFDGGVLSLNAMKCRVLLAQSTLKFCNLQLFAQLGCRSKKQQLKGLSRLQSIEIVVDGGRFTLTSSRLLAVNGKLKNLPYSQTNVRVFRSGDDIVFVQKKCKVWVTFDGQYTATFRLGKLWRNSVRGLAGNCDGNAKNDPRTVTKSLLRSKYLTKCRLLPRRSCRAATLQSAKNKCSRIITNSKCKTKSVLNPCIRDYCATAQFPKLQSKVLCANFYLHSRRCAKHNKPISWRVAAGCPAKCNRNEHFSSKMKPCPKTCDNHFFGSPKRCFKLLPSEGCQCNSGFVLDGSRCVRPENCVCLAKLCIDRAGNSKCQYWRSLGRCRKFPKFMSNSCRLTCGLCTPSCTNQVSNKLCSIYRKKGLCKKSFYRAMCKATCNPAGCGCPPRRVYKSRCSQKYRHIVIVSKRWWPDSNGVCQRSITLRYRSCGLCKRIRKTVKGRCNYCKKRRTDVQVIQFREKAGKRRCIRRTRRITRRCICKRRAVSSLRCVRHTRTERVTRFWKITARCSKCVKATAVKLIRKLNCRGSFTVGKCRVKANYVIVRKYKRYARNCKCRKRLVWKRKVMCRCRRATVRKVCSGNRWLIIKTFWLLRNGKCILKRKKHYVKIPCKRRYSKNFCRKCKAYRYVKYYALAKCRCKKFTKRYRIGTCCCRSSYKRVVRVSKYLKKEYTISFKLIKYKCKKIVKVRLIRIRCPRTRNLVKCNKRNGVKTFTKIYYVRKGHNCIRKVATRKSRTQCRRNVKRVKGKCRIRRGLTKYRITRISYSARKGCSCVRRSKKVRERCGCIKKRTIVRTKCPSSCRSKKCSAKCVRYVTFYRISSRGGRCKRIVFQRQRFRCCCTKRRKVKFTCSKNRYVIRKVCQTLLRKGKCQRVCNSSSKKVKCRVGRFVNWESHKNKNLRYKIIVNRFIANCKCRVKVTKKICKARCRRPVVKKFCDSVKRRWVWRTSTWKLTGCKTCAKSVSERSRKVKCRQGTIVKRRCLSNGVYLFKYTKFYQSKCLCKRRSWTVRKRCKCRKQVISKRRCRSNIWVRKVRYWVLRKHKCVQRMREIRKKVRCRSSRKTRFVCNKRSGNRTKFFGVYKPKRCRCKLVWKKVSRSKCNCIALNKSVSKKVRRFCRKNQKVTVRYYYKLKKYRCILRSRSNRRSIRCSRNFTKRHRCNLKKRKQLFVRHTFTKRNCKCVLSRKKIYRSCGCSKKILRRRKCIRAKGIWVTTFISQVWSHKRNRCETQTRTDSKRVACSRRTRYTTSKCIKNKYFIVKKIYYQRRNCKCIRKMKSQRRNCHCKNIVRKGKCPSKGFFIRVRTELRKWNMKKRKCVTVRFVTSKIRCRCRPNFTRKKCVNGYRVKERVTFKLLRGRCHKRVIRKKFKVVCTRKMKFAFTGCRKCWRLKKTLVPRLNKKKCTCYYAVVKTQKCACCCPKNKRTKRCVGNSHWQINKIFYTPFTGRKCSRKCRVSKQTRRVRVPCKRRRRFAWLRCNKKSCVQKQQLLEYRLRRCQCKLRKQLTGKIRRCCCLAKPRTKKICLNSRIFKRIYYQKLKRYRCVWQKKLKLLRIWKCKGRVGTVVGRCNKRTCRQRVQDKFSVVDKPRCRCKTVLRNSRYRRCCCNRKGSVTKRCLGKCIRKIITKYSFDRKRRVCVRNVRKLTKCIKCKRPAKPVIRSRCNKRTCRRKVTTITVRVHKCSCIRRKKTRSEICCCRKPVESGPSCIRGRKLVWRKTSWTLKSGRCVSKVTTRSKIIRCKRGVVRSRVKRCNKRSCKQIVMRLYLKLSRCQCRKVWRRSTRVCCCRPAVRRWNRCERNVKLVRYTVTLTLNSKRQCIAKKTSKVLSVVRNCNSRTKVGRCNPKSRKRIISIFVRKPRNCKCRTLRVVRKSVLCRCPKPRIIRGKCNRKNCHRQMRKIYYSSTKSGHGLKCKKHVKPYSLRCCCQRKQTQRVVCDKRTGSMVKVIKWRHYVARQRTCIIKSSRRVVKVLKCGRTRCQTSRCNRKTGYKIKVCTKFRPLLSKCSCVPKKLKSRIVCSCRKRVVRKKCINNRKLVTIKTWWRISLKQNKCIRNQKQSSVVLRCNKKTRFENKCKRNCKGMRIKYYYRMRNCKCKQFLSKQPILCCCKKTSRVARCQDNRIVTTIIKYFLRNYKCVRNRQKRVRVIRCRRKKIVSRTKCRKNCTFNQITRKFAVRKCKCKQISRKVRKLRCCCRRPFIRRLCRKGVIIVQRIRFILRRYKCLKKVQESRNTVQCRRTQVKVSRCVSHRKKRKISIRKFVRVGCKCKVRNSVRFEVCACPPAKIVRQRCTSKRRRKIFKFTWRLVRIKGKKPFCRKSRRLVRTEPCSCRKMQISSRCVSGNQVVTVRTFWKLRTRSGRNFCAVKTRTSQRIIRCKSRSVNWSKCRKYRKVRTIVFYKSVKCKCKKFIHRRTFACNCSRKNRRQKLCDSKTGRIITIIRKYFAPRGSKRCKSTTKKRVVRVKCNRKPVTSVLRKCAIRKNYGVYSQLLQKWQVRVACKCRNRSRRLLRLCRCNRGSVSNSCRGGNRKVKVTVRIIRKGNKCIRKRTVDQVRVGCKVWKPRVSYGGCNRRNCKRSATVRQCFVRKCRRQLYQRSKLQICCTPRPTRRTFCDKKKGEFVTVITTYRLVSKKPLLTDRNGNVLVKQRRVVKSVRRVTKPIRCRKPKITTTCSRTGKWKRVTFTWRRVACGCVKKRTVRVGRCKCPPRIMRWGRCGRKYKIRTIIRFILKARKCVRMVSTRKFLCRCKNRSRYTFCDKKGNWKKCTRTYVLNFKKQKCRKSVNCRTVRQTCSGPSVHRSKCTKFTRVISTKKWFLNKKKCSCYSKIFRRTVGCNCSKWRSSYTKCIRGSFATFFISHYLSRGKCRKRVKKSIKSVHCSKRKWRSVVAGSCVRQKGKRRSGMQKLRIKWLVKQKCRCKPKFRYIWVPCVCSLIPKYRNRKFVYCRNGNLRVFKFVTYVLRKFTCKKVVTFKRRTIRCKGTRRTVSSCRPNKNGDSFKIIKKYRKVSNGKCGCRWQLVSSVYRICKCRNSKLRNLCLRNRIRRKEKWVYVPVAGKRSCRRIVRRNDRTVSCKKTYTRNSKCRKCRFTRTYYAYKPVSCKCKKYVARKRNLRCCCPKATKSRGCDAKRNIIFWIVKSYKLVKGRCILKTRRITRRVRCKRKFPLYRISKCKSGYRRILKTTYRKVKCNCKQKVTRRKQRCSCSSKVTLKRGKCGKWFAIDVQTGWKLRRTNIKIPGTNKYKFKCVRVVLFKRKRRCRCPKPNRYSRCRGNRKLYSYRISYRIKGLSCQKIRKVSVKVAPCRVKPRLISRKNVYKKCSKSRKYVQKVKYFFIKARNCKCIRFSKTIKYICNCFKRFGGRKSKRSCLKNRTRVIFTWWYVNVGRKCVKRKKTVRKVIKCKGTKVTSGKCNKASRKRRFQIWRRVVKNCRCIWRRVRKVSAPCRCRSAVRSRRCAGRSWITVIRRWKLIGSGFRARCKVRQQKIVKKIRCKVGNFVHKSKCSSSGWQKIIRTVRKLQKCICRTKKFRSRCRCRCPKPKTRTYCRGNKVFTEVRTWKLRKCSCKGDRSLTGKLVVCRKRKRNVGACKRRKNGDKFRQITERWQVLRKCNCKNRKRVYSRLCGCDRRQRRRTRCVSNRIRVVTISARKLVRGKCRRTVLSRRRVPISCGKTSAKKTCNKKTGVFTIVVIKPFVSNCKCINTAYKYTRRCRCNERKKLISKGKCNKSSCRRRLLYKKQILKGMRCVWKKFHRFVRCCCKGGSVRRICKNGYWLIVRNKIVLRGTSCVRVVSKKRVTVKCKRNEKRRSQKLKNGVLKIKICFTIRKRCRCVRRCKVIFRRYRCYKARISKRCVCSGGRCKTKITVKSWKLVKGRCVASRRVRTKPLRCLASGKSRSKCRRGKFGFYSVVTHTRWLQRKCKCVRSTRTTRVICRCNKRRTERSCNKRTGKLTVRVISFRKSADRRQCRRVVKTNVVKISCKSKWRLIHKQIRGRYLIKTYRRSVRVGCKCRKRTRKVRCLIRCKKCRSFTKCSRHRTKKTVRVCWKPVSCRCVRRENVTNHRVVCPKMRVVRNCNKKSCILTAKHMSYVPVNCKCKVRVKTVRSRCCCPKPRKVRSCRRGAIRIRKLRWQLKAGRCHVKSSDVFVPVRCPSRRRFAISGSCVRGRRKYKLHFYRKVGCHCKKAVKTVTRPCFCARKAVELYFAVDLHDKNLRGYRPAVRKFIARICSTFHKQKVLARTTFLTYGTRVGVKGQIRRPEDLKIKRITNSLFVKRRTVLSSAIDKIYRIVRIRKQKHVHPIVVIISCGKHPDSHRIVKRAKRLQKIASVLVVHVGKLTSKNRYLKLVASSPSAHNFLSLPVEDLLRVSNHKFPATQIFERVCKRSCKKSRVHRSGCNRRNCKRTYKKITYIRSSGKCKRRVKTWRRDCCCSRKGRRYSVCRKNRKYIITVTYHFNALRELCVKRVNKDDVTARLLRRCRPPVRIIRGKCIRMWRRDQIIKRRVSACKCILSRSTRRVRCGCPRPIRKRRCFRGRKWQTCITKFTLSAGKCNRKTNCSFAAISCKPQIRKVSKCRRCKKRISRIWYVLKNCKCVRRYSVVTRKCCCSKRVIVRKFCDKKRHRYVTVRRRLKLVNGKCVIREKRTYRNVRCRSGRTIRGKCRPAGGHYYQSLTVVRYVRVGCKCKKIKRVTRRICRCRRSRIIRKCQSGRWISTKIWWQLLSGKCRRRTKVVGRQTVTCRTRKQMNEGRCNISKKGLRYRRVTVTYQRRSGCKCVNVRKQILKLCGCKKNRTVISCRSNRIRVRTVYSYRLINGKCKMSRNQFTHKISCKLAKTKLGKCIKRWRIAKVTAFTPVNCRCKPRVYSRKVRCNSCSDLLPTKVCRTWAASRYIRLCDNHPHYAKRLCPYTCGLCFNCKEASIVFSVRVNMRKQVGFRSSYIISKGSSLKKCIKSCYANKKCRSVNFNMKANKCLLLRVTRRDLSVRSGGAKLKLGGNWLLFERVCRKSCPYRKFVKKYKCRCKWMGKKVCYRLLKVATFWRNSSGRCKRKVRLMRVPCRQCEDLTHRKWCLSHKKRCTQPKVRRKCPFTCRVCKRKPLVLTQKGKCKNGKQIVTKLVKVYDKVKELWRVKKWSSAKPCVKCQTGSYSIIGECIRGKRKVTRVVARIVGKKCKVSSHSKTFSCKGCPFSLRRVIGSCKKRGKSFTRIVVTFFTVRRNKRCVVLRNRRVFHCSRRCSKDRISRSRCICGKRIRCITYFVTFPGSSVCIPRTHSSTEICQSAGCRNQMRLVDCLTVKRNGMCKNRKMQHLCAKTCGFCK